MGSGREREREREERKREKREKRKERREGELLRERGSAGIVTEQHIHSVFAPLSCLSARYLHSLT
jgi:hypothetical protein